jgi:hypothetical protein
LLYATTRRDPKPSIGSGNLATNRRVREIMFDRYDLDQDVDKLAHEAAGNWKEFESFAWFDRPEDADRWCIVYTSNRDSGLVDESNADAIEEIMSDPAFEDDVRSESHSHWAVGHVDGFSIRCFGDDGAATKAFKAMVDIARKLEDYPLLDEDDHSRREYEATLENISSVGRRFLKDERQVEDEVAILVAEAEAYVDALKQVVMPFADLPCLPKHDAGFGRVVPEDWSRKVFSWLWDNDQRAVESVDDGGGYPPDDSMKDCLKALGWLDREYDEYEDAA